MSASESSSKIGKKLALCAWVPAIYAIGLAIQSEAHADDTLPPVTVTPCPGGGVPIFTSGSSDYECGDPGGLGGGGPGQGGGGSPGGGGGGETTPTTSEVDQANKCVDKFGGYTDPNGTKHVGPKPGFTTVFSSQYGWIAPDSSNSVGDVMPTNGPAPTVTPKCGGVAWTRQDVGTTVPAGSCVTSGNLQPNTTYIWVSANASPLLLAETLNHEYAAQWGASQDEVNNLDSAFEAAYTQANGNCN